MILTEANLSTREQALELAKNLTEMQQNALYIASFKLIADVENEGKDKTGLIYKENCQIFEAIEFLRETGYEFKK